MSVQSSSLRAAAPADPMEELRLFIMGANKQSKCISLEMTKSALLMLKTLPAARLAILEYLSNVLDIAAKNYIIRIEKEISTGKVAQPNEYDETTLAEVHSVLCGFVVANAEAWAPIISTWSLELLGKISSQYAGRAHACTGLNDVLQLWMNCRATRTLIDITTQCLSSLMHSNTEACINALLDTSVKHSPNFDWVVAHVGSCFPQTVIVRVLSCGLKDFCLNKTYQGSNSPKLKSVVGILGHLTTSHSTAIQKALLDMFNWGLEETAFHEGDVIRNQRKATVPYLVQILTLSSKLLSTIGDEIRRTIPINVFLKLYQMTDDWCKYIDSPDGLQDLLSNLILSCEKGGVQIIQLLLDCVNIKTKSSSVDEVTANIIKTNAWELLEYILSDIDYSVRRKNYIDRKPLKLLNSLIFDVEEVCKMLVSSEDIESQTASRIINCIGQHNPPVLIQALSFILHNSTTDEQLAFFVRILGSELVDKTSSPYYEKGGHFSVVLEQILEKHFERLNGFTSFKSESLEQTWRNLLKLLKWEKSNAIFALKTRCISKGIEYNLLNLTEIFKVSSLGSKCSHILCEILHLLDIPKLDTIPLQVTLKLVCGTVNYFFNCCKETDELLRMNGFKRTLEMFRRLSCHSKVCRNKALRHLLERSLFEKADAELFGAQMDEDNNNTEVNKQLIIQNKKISKTIHLTKHSSVFNGGIIGNGKRKSICVHRPPIDLVSINTRHLIASLKACCGIPVDTPNDKIVDVSLDSLTLVSLMLVQLISPDVMYNGLPWPEEEFSKVTIERDLLIRRLFNQKPLLWDLLNFVASYRPALCYCSVLLRALTATLMHQWTSMGDQSKSCNTDSYKALMDTTVRVIDVMALGQLLPPPLSSVRDVVPFLNSYEIVAILRECIWCYMRDHIPSPALFVGDSNGLMWRDPTVVRPADPYTKTLRIIMQRNIKTVGHLYSQMFITLPTSD
ncbi:PREDICTED: integrator complex subunit 5 [Nicrophorus vespilloides]|uniref:Integrator complex subunit 5 n=1 Tax=Nicrophorus vespilloides TaxID=110193 RepID=A0ABM1MRI7_NICVS|nr:PREDICTED: integrator complex subunit 5 [Nicrophorus vespilloides]